MHFHKLRKNKAKTPDLSPVQDDILSILKIVCEKTNEPVKVLFKIGIIIFIDKIAINSSSLHFFLSSCKSRLNNTLKKNDWKISPMNVNKKIELLQHLIDRKEIRNWTIRIPPKGSSIFNYISLNTKLIYKSNDLFYNISSSNQHNPKAHQIQDLLSLNSTNIDANKIQHLS